MVRCCETVAILEITFFVRRVLTPLQIGLPQTVAPFPDRHDKRGLGHVSAKALFAAARPKRVSAWSILAYAEGQHRVGAWLCT